MQAQLQAAQIEAARVLLPHTLHRSERLLAVIDALMDILRDGVIRLNATPCTLSDLTGMVFENISAEADLSRFEYDVAADLPPFSVDVPLVAQVVVHLLEFALSKASAGARIHLSARAHGEGFRITISDPQPDLLPDEQATVAGLFTESLDSMLDHHQAPALVFNHLVSLSHGGAVWCEQPAEGGLSYCLSLPAQPTQATFDVLAHLRNTGNADGHNLAATN